LLDLVSWMAFTKSGKWDTQVQSVQVDQTISPFAWLDQPCRFLFPGFAYVSIFGRLATYWNRRLSGCFIAARYIGKLSFHHFPFFPLILFGPLWILFYLIKPLKPWLDKLAALGVSCVVSTVLIQLAPSGFLNWFCD